MLCVQYLDALASTQNGLARSIGLLLRPMSEPLEAVIRRLQESRSDVADELQALQAIFGDESVSLHESKSWNSQEPCVLQSDASGHCLSLCT